MFRMLGSKKIQTSRKNCAVGKKSGKTLCVWGKKGQEIILAKMQNVLKMQMMYTSKASVVSNNCAMQIHSQDAKKS